METNVRETFLHIFVKFVFCGDDDECLLRLIELWQWIRLFCGYFHVIHDHYFIFPFFFKDKFCIGYWNACQWKNWNYYAFEIRVFLCKLSQAYIWCIFLILHIQFANKHSFLSPSWTLTIAWQWCLNYIKVHNKSAGTSGNCFIGPK